MKRFRLSSLSTPPLTRRTPSRPLDSSESSSSLFEFSLDENLIKFLHPNNSNNLKIKKIAENDDDLESENEEKVGGLRRDYKDEVREIEVEGLEGVEKLEFEMILPIVEGEEISCKVGNLNSEIMPKVLRDKYPKVVLVSGVCDEGSKVQLNFLFSDDVKGDVVMQGYIVKTNGAIIYYDPTYVFSGDKTVGRFVAYNVKDAYLYQQNENLDLQGLNRSSIKSGCEVEDDKGNSRSGYFQGRIGESEIFETGYKFRIAIVANKEYSTYFGVTKAQTLQAVVNLLSRINAIYARELGVYFTMLDNADELFCIKSSSDPACAGLGNDVDTLINQIGTFLDEKGVAFETYDLAHALMTGSGGKGGVGGLCTTSKMRGVSGSVDPVGDAFYVDFVAHEIGHQLGASHCFQDCSDSLNQDHVSLSNAVEPGSGSTIMSYAGICGANNLALHSDPYFNSLNLVQIRQFIESSYSKNVNCGIQINLNNSLPPVHSVKRCSLPQGNYFHLKGSVESATEDVLADGFYNWEMIQPQAALFGSKKGGQFRSYEPRFNVLDRFFPNLFFLSFPDFYERVSAVEQVLDFNENTEEKEVNFRFTGRNDYERNAFLNMESFESTLISGFVYSDTVVTFVRKRPMKIKQIKSNGDVISSQNFLNYLIVNKTVEIYVDFGETFALVERFSLEIARSKFNPDGIYAEEFVFDHTSRNVELEWLTILDFSLTDIDINSVSKIGVVKFPMPDVFLDNNVNAQLMLKAQTSYLDYCYFFDYFPNVNVVVKKPGEVIIVGPTSVSGHKNAFYQNLAGMIVLIVGLGLVFGVILFYAHDVYKDANSVSSRKISKKPRKKHKNESKNMPAHVHKTRDQSKLATVDDFDI